MRLIGKGTCFDIPGQAQFLQKDDAVPIKVDFVPGEPVARRLRVSMVVVVPAFTEGKYCDPKAVPRCVGGVETTRPPHVRCGVHQPRGMQAEDCPEENSPQQERQSTDKEEDDAETYHRKPMPSADPHMEPIFSQVRNQRKKGCGVVVHRLSCHQPANV